MNSFRILIVSLVMLLLAACSKSYEVSDVQFGTFTGVGTKSITFQAETSFSRHKEAPFGWLLVIRNPPNSFEIKEIIAGPQGTVWEPPKNSPGVLVSESGRVATVTKVISQPHSPFLFHNWVISDSDPVGKYKASLYLDGKLVNQIEFNVTN